MNALQSHSYPSPDPRNSSPSPRKPRPRSRLQQRQAPHRAMAIETTVKLGLNLLFAGVSLSALMRLVPANLEQQEDLQRLQTEVSEANSKVASLQSDFDRHFDPQQAMNVMQEQNIRFNPRQRQVVWLHPETKPSEAETQPSDSSDATSAE